MGVGGEGAEKITSKGGAVKKRGVGIPKAQMNKKPNRKERAKNGKSSERRSKSLSKETTGTRTTHVSKNSSINSGNESADSGDGDSSNKDAEAVVQVGREIASLAKPEKLEKESMTVWSETSECCVCCIDRSTVIPCTCYEPTKAFSLPVARETGKNTTGGLGQGTVCISLLSKERDYYKSEFQKLLKIFEKLNDSNEAGERKRLQCGACDKKDQMIEYLRRENQDLAREKYFLMTRLEEGGTRFDMQSSAGICLKLPCKRVERERDLLKFDVQRLEEENDCLREKIKVANESKARECVKFQEQRVEYENIISKLDEERRELIQGQGIRKITINALEEKVHTYSDLYRVEQDEKERVKNQYHQLKQLHDQCDKALLDTQAQLMEVEAELLNYQKKHASDNSTKVKHLEHQKSERLNASVRKTKEFEKDEEKDDIISRLEDQNTTLEKELRGMENEVTVWKRKCKNIELDLGEKKLEFEILQNENTERLTELKALQKNLEEKESVSRVLHAEVEHLNKETNALVTTNHQQQEDIHKFKVQVSVAMETITELENKVKQLQAIILEYEEQIKKMKSDLDKFESQTSKKNKEIDQLLDYKISLEKTKDVLDVETEENKRKICDLECQCQKLQANLMTLTSKEKLISDLNSKLTKMKAEKEALDKENAELSKRATKMENKLFQCICTICDNTQDKCTMLKHFLSEQANFTSARGGTFVNVMVSGGGTRDVATQVCSCGARSRNSKIISNINTQIPASIDEEKTSRSITIQNVLPEASVQSDRYKDSNIFYPIYGAVDLGVPFSAKQYLEKLESPNTTNNGTPNDTRLNSVPEFQWSYFNSTPYYPSIVEGEFIMDNNDSIAYKLTQTEIQELNKN